MDKEEWPEAVLDLEEWPEVVPDLEEEWTSDAVADFEEESADAVSVAFERSQNIDFFFHMGARPSASFGTGCPPGPFSTKFNLSTIGLVGISGSHTS